MSDQGTLTGSAIRMAVEKIIQRRDRSAEIDECLGGAIEAVGC